jgi:DNA-3-methyladenine glycosylase
MTQDRRAAPLPVAFFERDAVTVARELLGKLLVTRVRQTTTIGRIVEVEAYLGAKDPASHAFQFRRHAQNEGLYGPPGNWYVYLSYGVHWCANLVAGPPGLGSAVLIRALEPVAGLPLMRRRRGVRAERLLCSGPGRLTQALGINRQLDQRTMPETRAQVLTGPAIGRTEMLATPRVGITKAIDWPLRFVVRESPWLSRGPGNE